MIEIKNATEKERKQLEHAISVAEWQLKECGIRHKKIEYIEINRRAKRRWGQCKCDGLTGKITINLSELLFTSEAKPTALLQTLLHEMCHAIKPEDGHSGAWKQATEKLNRKFGYSISRTTTCEEVGVAKETLRPAVHYTLRCDRCGHLFLRNKASNLTKYPEHYRCKCGGKIHLVR